MARGAPVTAPLVVHVIERLSTGGMENGVVNLINNTPPGRYRHAVVCLRYFDSFRDRIVVPDIEVTAIGKGIGKDPGFYVKLWRELRRLNPAIVHTRNLPAADCAVIAAAAGVRARVHGEHGKDVLEATGKNWKYNTLRRAVSPLVQRYIAVSREIESWLAETVGIPRGKIRQIYNGVDSVKFAPARAGREALPAPGIAAPDSIVIGTVGRMEAIKDQLTLARAFVRLSALAPDLAPRLRLVMVGDGSLREPARALLAEAGLTERAWLPGERGDIPALLRGLDIFALPSRYEGISNTIIEAMASGLPVVATRVGGNGELVVEGETGALVPPEDADAMAEALRDYVASRERRLAHGAAGRAQVERRFSMQNMVNAYLGVYDEVVAR
jgi:sugar transferase (PEP-CTERM/EpsH1 system associated)